MGFEHGEHSLLVIGNIIHITCKGNFNEYGVKAVFKNAKEKIDRFNGSKFSIVFNYLEIEGATPEAFEEINLNNIWLSNQNIIAKAVVINSIVFRAIDEKRVPAQKSIRTEFFTDIEKAIDWVLLEEFTESLRGS